MDEDEGEGEGEGEDGVSNLEPSPPPVTKVFFFAFPHVVLIIRHASFRTSAVQKFESKQ